ncbi:hypothetical protein ACFLQN_03630 [Candidatus Aenigmatarchaeota archaeon]
MKSKYLTLLVYVIVFNISIVVSTVVIHEIGHFSLGAYYGCDDMKIILYDDDNSAVYTQMTCESKENFSVLALGGFLLTIPFALSFLLLKNRPERYFSLIAIGFNLTVSTSDVTVFDTSFLPLLLIVIGGLSIIIGENLLINKYIETYID